MSFPTTPLDNEIAVVNGISYIYNTAFNSWTKVTPANLNFVGNVYITSYDSLGITANSVLPKSYIDVMSTVFGT